MKKPSTPRSKRTVELFLGTLFTLVGLVCAAWLGPATRARALASESFVSTPAVVRAIGIGESKSKGKRRYTVPITYAYTVDGREYEASDWSVVVVPGFASLPKFPSRADAEALAAKYPVGREFEVYVDPADPDTAVIERGGADKASWMIGFGLLFAAIGSFALWRGFTRHVPP